MIILFPRSLWFSVLWFPWYAWLFQSLYTRQGETFLALAYAKLGISGRCVDNPDRSWCHRHTSVKLSWSQPIDSEISGSTRVLRPIELYTSVEVPSQRPIVPSFTSLVHPLINWFITTGFSAFLVSYYIYIYIYTTGRVIADKSIASWAN